MKKIYSLEAMMQHHEARHFDGLVACKAEGHFPHYISSAPVSKLDFYSAFLIEEGEMSIYTDDKQSILRANDLLLTPPLCHIKKVETTDECKVVYLLIEPIFFNSIHAPDSDGQIHSSAIHYTRPVISRLESSKSKELLGICKQIESTILAPHIYKKEIIKSLIYICKTFLAEQQLDTCPEPHDFSHKENVFKIFLHLANSNFKKHRQIDYYADRLCMTSTYLSRIVREISGNTVNTYLNRLLYDEAKKQLAETNKTLGEISYDLHFSDQSAFSNFFKSKSGMTPKAFRTEKKQVAY